MNRISTSVLSVLAFLLAGFTQVSAQWSTVANAGFSSSSANYTVMAVDANNTPYIAYSDNSKSNKLTVERLVGTSWISIGGKGVSASSVSHISMFINGTDVYVGFRDDAQNGKATVMKYNGTSWSTVGSAGLSAGSAYYVKVAMNTSGTLYVAYQDQTKSGKGTVRRFTGSAWSNVGSSGFTTGQSDYIDFAIDGNDNLYVSFRDNNDNWKAKVMKHNGSSWSTLGSGAISPGNVAEMAIAIDGNNKPYVVYEDLTKNRKATVESFNGSSWSVVGSAGFSSGYIGDPDLVIDGNNTPYLVYKDGGNSDKATVMTYNGSSWSSVSSAGFSSSSVKYTSIAFDGNNTMYVGFRDGNNNNKATVMKHAGAPPSITTWTGSSSTNWNTAANWSTNAVPTSAESVKIPSGKSRYPNITSGTSRCKNIEIASGASVTVDGGKLEIAGTITNNGTFDAEDGTIELNGSSAQTLSGSVFKNNTVENFELNNGSGCTLTDTLKITDTYTPNSGKMKTNDKLVLKSTSTRTARVGAGSSSGNYFDGKVTVERYIPGKRAYRFLSHPFSVPIALSELMDDIDITGQGGTSNGFTAVQVNDPSAFWWDINTADNSSYGNNPGWKDYTNATSASWLPYQMARIFIRGRKGQGLSGSTYYPDAVTLDMTGYLNTGDKLVGLDKGSNSYYVICGNPYQSAVNLKNVARTNIYNYFTVWDATQGTRGGYTSYNYNYDYYLPANAAFVTYVYSNANKGFIDFQESDKVSNGGTALFKGTASNNYVVELKIEDTAIYWDRLLINFDKTAMSVQDTSDLKKLRNPDVDFYTLSDDNTDLAIDSRPYEANKSIKLGLLSNDEEYTYVLRVPQYNVPEGTKLMLHDKFANKTEELKEGFEYWFDITKDTNSFGNNRFEINMVGEPTNVEETISNNNEPATRMLLIPNPAHNTVKVSFDNLKGLAVVKVSDLSGRVVYIQRVNAGVGSVIVPLADIPNGVYLVELAGENVRMVEKLIKQ